MAKTKKKKGVKKKKTGGAAADDLADTAVPKVRVRMFRQGLGDCFLVTLDAGGDERHILIDCGTLGSSAAEADKVKVADIGEHVLEMIGASGRLHVVVATHEHQDHLSGFNNKELKKLKGRVDHVWLAWTENPADADAQKYAVFTQDLGQALAMVAGAVPDSDVGMQVKDLLGFAGDTSILDGSPLAAAEFAKTVHQAMEFIRTEVGGIVDYHDPGDLIEDEFLPGFRIYVLGPPRNEDLIKDLGKHGSSELYGLAAGLRSAARLHLAAAHLDRPLSAEERMQLELELPFDSRFNHPRSEREAEMYPAYADPASAWRQLADDWLSAASDLALQLDSMTNNSSLVLAIERIADGKVLLFPADAQQGNWLSWHVPAMKWTVPTPGGGTQTVTAADLLSRTVFYKVGHHASHNATARGKGLELMQRQDELVAFIPVDRAIALGRNPKDSWQMPARPLYLELLKKCQGRVVRADTGWAAKAVESPGGEVGVEDEFIGMGTAAEWTAWKAGQQAAEAAGRIKIEQLYVEYVLE